MERKFDKLPIKSKFQVPDIGKSMQTLFRSKAFREFASGALSGAMTKTAVAPLETIRTRIIVGVGSKKIGESFKEVMEQQGWQGLWIGNGINLLRIVPSQAIELCTFEGVKRYLISAQKNWEKNGCPQIPIAGHNLDLPVSWMSPVAISGAVAGVISTVSCYPLEVLKDRFTVHPGAYQSINHAVKKISHEEGPGALYVGLAPTLIGLTSSTISFPLEVARKRLMVGVLEGKRPTNMINVIREIIQEEGFQGLYRGWGASCLKVMPSSGLSWMFYEAWKDVLLIEGSNI